MILWSEILRIVGGKEARTKDRHAMLSPSEAVHPTRDLAGATSFY